MKRNKWIDGVNHSVDRHARKRLRERKITIHQVWDTAADPDEYEELTSSGVRVSKMYDGKKLQLILHAIDDFILIKTAYWDDEYTEDERAQQRAKVIAAKEQHNKRIAKHDHRYRTRQRNAPS